MTTADDTERHTMQTREKPPFPCDVYKGMSAMLDERIAYYDKRAENAGGNVGVTRLALSLAESYQTKKENALSSHAVNCRKCSGPPPQIGPVRCDAYARMARHFGKEVHMWSERARKARGHQDKKEMTEARDKAERRKERYLVAHMAECWECG
ncbi:hypothetical protein [Streptomyces sp. NPDC005970]|uniref:hypothetical protein n=1 Tax=Streptomyces sp. NPDC005970 TaxID=3156723 RepID=UPI0033ED6A9E